MTLEVSVAADIRQLKTFLNKTQKKRLPSAIKSALARTGFLTRKKSIDDIRAAFDSPVRATVRSPLYVVGWRGKSAQRVNDRDLWVDVHIRGVKPEEQSSSQNSPNMWLEAEVDGGARKPKRFEKALIAKGIIAPGQYAIISKDAQDASGNFGGGKTEALLSQLGAAEIVGGYMANRTERSRKRARTGSSQYFTVGKGGKTVAILARGKAGKRSSSRGKSSSVVMGFTSSAPRYRNSLDFYRSNERYMNRIFPRLLTEKLIQKKIIV